MNNDSPEKKILSQCQTFFDILKSEDPNYSLEKKTGFVRYLEKITCPTFLFSENNKRRAQKRKVRGFRDKKHLFEHVRAWLDTETERLNNIKE